MDKQEDLPISELEQIAINQGAIVRDGRVLMPIYIDVYRLISPDPQERITTFVYDNLAPPWKCANTNALTN